MAAEVSMGNENAFQENEVIRSYMDLLTNSTVEDMWFEGIF